MTKKPSELFENYDTSVFKEVTTPKTRKVRVALWYALMKDLEKCGWKLVCVPPKKNTKH